MSHAIIRTTCQAYKAILYLDYVLSIVTILLKFSYMARESWQFSIQLHSIVELVHTKLCQYMQVSSSIHLAHMQVIKINSYYNRDACIHGYTYCNAIAEPASWRICINSYLI